MDFTDEVFKLWLENHIPIRFTTISTWAGGFSGDFDPFDNTIQGHTGRSLASPDPVYFIVGSCYSDNLLAI